MQVILTSETPATVEIIVALRSFLPLPVTFTALTPQFSSSEYIGNKIIFDSDAADGQQVLIPNTTKVGLKYRLCLLA